MKIIVTGGSGLLARYIVAELQKSIDEISVVVSDQRALFATDKLYNDKITVIPESCFFKDDVLKEKISGACIINTAFTRKNEGHEIAKSLDYAYRLFAACKKYKARSVINCSSRSVYEQPASGEYNTEDSPINADSLIATAKYGSELLLKAFFNESDIQYTNLRIASVNELKLDNNMTRPLNVFVDCVLDGKNITVFNGKQIMSFVDPRDVAKAIRMVCTSENNWKEVYNVGSGTLCTTSLYNMAKRVVEIGVELGYTEVGIDIIEKDISQTAGLNIERIQRDFGFVPDISLDDMIRSLFEMKTTNV